MEKDGVNKFKGCVVDESNHYYQQIRTYLKNTSNYSRMTISE